MQLLTTSSIRQGFELLELRKSTKSVYEQSLNKLCLESREKIKDLDPTTGEKSYAGGCEFLLRWYRERIGG